MMRSISVSALNHFTFHLHSTPLNLFVLPVCIACSAHLLLTVITLPFNAENHHLACFSFLGHSVCVDRATALYRRNISASKEEQAM